MQGYATGSGEAVLPQSLVRAPFVHSWGQWTYHNAMVSAVDAERSRCTVLFLVPTHPSMVPCQRYLAGECRATVEGSCRYSHGTEVNLSELEPYVAPDFR